MTFLNSISVADDAFKARLLEQCLQAKSCLSIGFANQHAYNLIHRNKDIAQNFADLDYVLRDGVGIEIAMKLHLLEPGINLNGTDYIPELIKQIDESRQDVDYYCYGTKQPWLSEGVKVIFGGKECKVLDGFQDDSAYIKHLTENANSARLSVLILAMGIPKQERIARQIKANIETPLVIMCGGGVVDFSAGRFKRAPKLMRKLRLEWLHRLLKEPRRLAGRYLIGGPLFFYYLFINRFK